MMYTVEKYSKFRMICQAYFYITMQWHIVYNVALPVPCTVHIHSSVFFIYIYLSIFFIKSGK
jgi:hypothetical protein